MYSSESLFTRFSDNPPRFRNANHLITVTYSSSEGWRYDNNRRLIPFTPQPSDVLIAEVDFSADTVTPLDGLNTTINGITAGYETSDIVIVPNRWNGRPNAGEFDVSGSFFKRDCH